MYCFNNSHNPLNPYNTPHNPHSTPHTPHPFLFSLFFYDLQRREDIRKVKLFNITSTKIQTQFRMYRARQELYMLRELKRLGIAEENMKGEIKRMGIWWTNRHDIPSKKLYMNEKGESVTGESISSLLPPLKTFGRKRDHLTSIGWGRRDGWARWLGLSSSLEIDDSHPTQFFTKKLFKKGYDNRRIQRYKGLTVQALYDDSAKVMFIRVYYI